METKILFGVGLVFETPEFGIIVMGANEELDELLPSTIKEMIGDQIIIKKTDGEEQILEVVSTQINHSISGKKNIGICLGKGISPDEVPAGSIVYCYR
ncbi:MULTISPECIES: hypothetical protein [unclassified Paenibacillus]|uniref:hypothetical protein n=1 Tax=unclassified Paenibacillus TaxID=185978 RepID=UPI0008D28811|nr:MULTISPECIES: hypothetical protein [unclassified Paenibacillus]QLG42026.1 hypothetical protein HW560_30515 [Paenibacillus sp. E222]SEM96558.1 hypothetical protein SAMN05518670_0721 [Paenibacillus sp. OK076]